MDQTIPNEKKATSTPTSASPLSRSKPSGDRMNIPLSTLAQVYPNDFVLHYVIIPTAPHIWFALACITLMLVGYYEICSAYWSNGDVCLLQTNWILFAVECVLFGLMGYTTFLKGKIARKQYAEDRERERERERALLEK